MNGLIWERPDRPVLFEGHETDGLTEIAIQRIDSLQKKCEHNPFCLFISYQAPHPPCIPLSPYQEIYSEVDLCIESNTVREALFKNHFWGADYDTQEFRRRYYSEISHIDAAFGKILSPAIRFVLSGRRVLCRSARGGNAGARLLGDFLLAR